MKVIISLSSPLPQSCYQGLYPSQGRQKLVYAPRLVIEHNTWQNKFYLFLSSLARSYFLFLEMFNLSETVLIIDRHLTRSFTVSFQLCRIFPVFKMLLQLSLIQSLWRPIGREPSASSPYKYRLQVLLSSRFIFHTWNGHAQATVNDFVQARLQCLQRQTLRVLLH